MAVRGYWQNQPCCSCFAVIFTYIKIRQKGIDKNAFKKAGKTPKTPTTTKTPYSKDEYYIE